MSEQHSSNTINRQHVVETSTDFLLKQIQNQRLHVANLLAKTGDKDSYSYLQDVFQELHDAIVDIAYDAQADISEYYEGQANV
jgi:hypothetical protein